MPNTICAVTTSSVNNVPEARNVAPVGPTQCLATKPLNGNVQLSGFGWISPPNGSFATVTFSGSVRVSGDGGTLTGSGSFSFTDTVFVSPGGYVTADLPLQLSSIPIQKNGKTVGTGVVSGNIFVSGFRTGSTLNLNGSGPVWGSATVQDQAKGHAAKKSRAASAN